MSAKNSGRVTIHRRKDKYYRRYPDTKNKNVCFFNHAYIPYIMFFVRDCV